MSPVYMNLLFSKLDQVRTAINSRRYQEAGKMLEDLDTQHPKSIYVFNMQAELLKIEGALDDMAEILEKSLKISPQQPLVISELALFYYKRKSFLMAEVLYKKALKISPADNKLKFNYALTLRALNKLNLAKDLLLTLLKHKNIPQSVFQLLGNIYHQTGDYDIAVEVYDQGLKFNHLHQGLLLSKTNTLKVRKKFSEALECIKQLKIENTFGAIDLYQMAILDIERKHYEQAERSLLLCLKANPSFIAAHDALNKMYWEQNWQGKFLNSYQDSLIRVPNSRDLHFSHIAMCLTAKQYERAQTALNKAKAAGLTSHQFTHLEGVLSLRFGDINKALFCFEKALLEFPEVPRYAIDKANTLIRLDRLNEAIELLVTYSQKAPFNQEIMGYLELCLRLKNDKGPNDLSDFNNLICSQKLEKPSRYTSFQSFWDELKATVNDLHDTINQPLDQSVQNGTQTSGDIHALESQIIQDYKIALENRIHEYITELPDDSSHHFLVRKSQQFYFSGSWSVKLENNGYHSNHIHPKGWLSSCTYLTVPETIRKDDNTKSGWLKFGESSLDIKENGNIELEICPEEGLCVLFPAYFWHGTHPVKGISNQFRTTLLSDIEPIAC